MTVEEPKQRATISTTTTTNAITASVALIAFTQPVKHFFLLRHRCRAVALEHENTRITSKARTGVGRIFGVQLDRDDTTGTTCRVR